MLSGSAQTRRTPGFSTLGRRVWARRLLIGRNAAARRPSAADRRTGQERDIDQEIPMKRKRHPSEQHRAPSLTSVIYPRKRLEGKPPSLPKSFSCLLHRRILQGKDRQHATLGAEIT